MMQSSTLVFPIDRPENRVLLGLKKTGFAAGKYLGFGGKVKAGETLAVAAARELQEESRLLAEPYNLWYAAHLTFLFPARAEWSQVVHVFRLEFWLGGPGETTQVRPEWFDFNQLPFEQMWSDTPYWLPQVLSGLKPKMRFTFAQDHESVLSVEELD